MPLIGIIEDEALVSLDIARSLTKAGYLVADTWSSAERCLQSIKSGTSVDLLLIDISLSGELDGTDLAGRISEQGGPATVFITAHTDDATLAKVNAAHALGYLVKPFGERELLGTVGIALYRAGMERKLQESEQRYRGLFEKSMSARFVCGSDGRIVSANDAFIALCDKAESFLSLLSDEGDWERIRTTISDSGRFGPEELHLVKSDGRELRALASIAPIVSMRTGIAAKEDLQGELVDQTEAASLRDAVAQARKMESLGRLAGGVAHDFNNVLTAIMGHANLLKLDLEPNDKEALEDVEGIMQAAGKAADITRQLQSFSRKQPYSPRAIDLSREIGDSEKMLRRLVGESILLSVDKGENIPAVLADPVQISQALINLVVNAKDALEGRSDGIIAVSAAAKSIGEARRIGNKTLPPGTYAVLDITDNGAGMSAAVAAKAFEPFFTTKAEGKGTGLGLSIVYSAAMVSGGAIDFETAPGRGTHFSLWLPAVENPPAGAVPQKAEGRDSGGDIEGPDIQDAANRVGRLKGVKILLVDDEEIVLGSLSRLLVRAGASVVGVHNPGEAILAAEKRKFDILISDIAMPFMNGFDLSARLTANGRIGSSLFISGKPDESLPAGTTSELLEKPFTAEALLSGVVKLVPESSSEH